MNPSGTKESGMSLIELMIGVSILALIAYSATHFFSRLTQSDAEISAKAKAQSELALLTAFLEKDLKFRDLKNPSDICPDPLCNRFKINRLAPGGGNYEVEYVSDCVLLPTDTIYEKLRFDSTGLSNVDSQCIKVVNCQQGMYPVLTITTRNVPPGSKIPAYPEKTPIDGQRRAAYNLVGASICATKTITTPSGAGTVSQNRIILEGAYLGPNKSVHIERQETVFSSNNMAKIQMLPN